MNSLINLNSVRELLQTFDTEEKCRTYLANLRWKDNFKCPHCNSEGKIYQFKDGKHYKCASCKKRFTATTNTIFHGAHIQLRDWFYAIYVFVNHKKGLSSLQMSKDLRVTQKTAWFMLHKIRYAMKHRTGKLTGSVEIDETFVGGKNKNRHYNKKVKHSQGRSTIDKAAIFGFAERGGRVRTIQLGRLKSRGMQLLLAKFVNTSSVIYSDEYRAYNGLNKIFKEHHVVNHASYQYVDGDKTTNTIESFWSHLKRGIVGTYHKTSRKLLHRYCQEFEFRWNMRKEKQDICFETTIAQSFGRKMTYKMAISGLRY